MMAQKYKYENLQFLLLMMKPLKVIGPFMNEIQRANPWKRVPFMILIEPLYWDFIDWYEDGYGESAKRQPSNNI